LLAFHLTRRNVYGSLGHALNRKAPPVWSFSVDRAVYVRRLRRRRFADGISNSEGFAHL
jgi:hypothetical protein